ncbi:4a-hydroxytetrahydrobiopterin dehydratase [Polynucleobacter sp. MWH-Creno-3A4]|uniref:4a-hydroxytetrahydrobiopterin dehydratase n=1 Tax=Polynucleobacter sp. MWH-Creno-3A4 TaxID=1855886 RepID=UPI001C0AD403|nr:4a-hydroxytetrahydrobiopterin dehydratase [Polynucleobacter sp. MWH-Creno-3A4]MBU3606194.1 4a-hydroxytetrahydrobiopterin dehydratase [Polynucleobacter sp. MWH-Creno-3A4]
MKPSPLPQGFDFQRSTPSWVLDNSGKKLCRELTFSNFKQAFEFMSLSAQYAEKINHHPDWSNSWNKVSVELTTHSHQGLTTLDIQMAQAMNTFAAQVLAQESKG